MISDRELGNLMFGNSWGEYLVEPREDYQKIFADFLFAHRFDGYGNREGNRKWEFENDVFIIRPYYWGEDEEVAKLPNFVYKPTGLEIRWYKYPMRDAYSNQDVGLGEFKAIMDECAKSLREGDDLHG